jgi:hypothetical protein
MLCAAVGNPAPSHPGVPIGGTARVLLDLRLLNVSSDGPVDVLSGRILLRPGDLDRSRRFLPRHARPGHHAGRRAGSARPRARAAVSGRGSRGFGGPDRKATSKSVTANGCPRLDRGLELVTHQCALRRRDLYVYLRLHRLQPIADVNCCQPGERPANRAQDQIPERAGPGGWRTGVTAWSPQPRSSP